MTAPWRVKMITPNRPAADTASTPETGRASPGRAMPATATAAACATAAAVVELAATDPIEETTALPTTEADVEDAELTETLPTCDAAAAPKTAALSEIEPETTPGADAVADP